LETYKITWALHTTNDDEMTKKKDLDLKTLLFLNTYRIQIVQNIAQLSSKREFNQPPLFFNSLKFWKQLGWINIKSIKQVGIKSLN
jgi:hypothetical protein